ncbi:MAG: hypothetical protein ABW136_07860, partial [Steroidobacteraceae bacterium]
MALAVLVAVVSLIVIGGWLLGDRRLVTFFAGNAGMKFNQALALLLLAAAVLLQAARQPRTATAIAALSMSLALLTLAEHAGLPVSIDQLFIVEPATLQVTHPGRMAPGSAFAIVSLAIAVALAGRRSLRGALLAQIFAAITLLVGLQRLLSFVYGVSPFSEFGRWGMMGVHSAACLVALASCIVLLNPNQGIAALLRGQRPGSVLARRVWLPLLAFTVLFGCVLHWSGFSAAYGHGATLAVVGLVSAAVLAVAIGWTTNELNVSSDRLIQQRHVYAVLSAVNTAIARTRNRDELFDEACRLLVTEGRFASASIGLIGVGDDGLFRNAAGDHPLRDRQPVFSRSALSAFAEMPASEVARTGLPR